MYDYFAADEEKEFLEGIVESKSTVGLELGYTTFHRFEISANYKYIRTKNRQEEEAKLPAGDKRKQDWKSGWNTTENEFRLAVQFKY